MELNIEKNGPLFEHNEEKITDESGKCDGVDIDESGEGSGRDDERCDRDNEKIRVPLDEYQIVYIQGSDGDPVSLGAPLLVPKERLEQYIAGVVRECMLKYLNVEEGPTLEERADEKNLQLKHRRRNRRRKEKRERNRAKSDFLTVDTSDTISDNS